MKRLLLLNIVAVCLTACNANLGLKEAGESIGKVADNVADGVKQVPSAIGEAEKNLKNEASE